LLEAEALWGEEEASVDGVRITAAKCERWKKRARTDKEQKSTRTKDVVEAFDTSCSIVHPHRLLHTPSTDSSNTSRHEQSSDMLIMSPLTLPEDQANSFPHDGSTEAHLSPSLAVCPTKATCTGFSSGTLLMGSFEPVNSPPSAHLNYDTVQVREHCSIAPITPGGRDRDTEIITRLLSGLKLDPTDITFYGPPTRAVPEVSTSATDTISLQDLETCNHDGRLVPWSGKQATLHKTASSSSIEVTRHHGEKPSQQGTIVLVSRHYSSRKRTTNGALKYSFADVIFPSSKVVEPDPFSLEVYPFPQDQGRRLELRPTATLYEFRRMNLNECIAKINKLESAALGSNAAAMKLRRKLAAAYYNLGYYDKAEYQYKQILLEFEQRNGQNSQDYIAAKMYLAESVVHLGRPQEGNQMAQYAHILARRFCPGSSLYQTAARILANSFGRLGDSERANALLRDLVQMRLNASGPRHGDTINIIGHFCHSMTRVKRNSESEELLRLAVELSSDATDISDLERCTIRYRLGRSLYKQEKYAESEALLKETAKMSERLLGIKHELTLTCKIDLCEVLKAQNLLSGCHNILLEIIQVQVEELKEIKGKTIEAMADLSVVLIEMRKTDEACKWMRQALCYCVEIGGTDSERAEQFFEELSNIDKSEEQHEPILDLFKSMAIDISWIDSVHFDRVLSALSPQPCLLLLDAQRTSSYPSASATDTGYLHHGSIS
jgi:tetratricopeptide (TPR) repeat protein